MLLEDSNLLSLSHVEQVDLHGLGGPPHPVIVTIRDNRDYIRNNREYIRDNRDYIKENRDYIRDNRDYISVLLYSYYTTVTGWGVLLMHWLCVRNLQFSFGQTGISRN